MGHFGGYVNEFNGTTDLWAVVAPRALLDATTVRMYIA